MRSRPRFLPVLSSTSSIAAKRRSEVTSHVRVADRTRDFGELVERQAAEADAERAYVTGVFHGVFGRR
jgi:hypothetical protein